MESNIKTFEKSVADGQPIELYKFTQGDISYFYTSYGKDISITINDDGKSRTEKYFADVIERAEIRPNTTSSSSIDMEIKVWKDHPVGKLFQGAPPEKSITIKIYRLHATDIDKYDTVFYGVISQANFEGSDCKLIAKMENWLDKEVPRGMYQYFCKNNLYDHNCRLRKNDFEQRIFVDKVVELNIYSTQFKTFPDDHFKGGLIYYDKQIRMIESHKGEVVKIRYPFLREPHNEIIVTVGCQRIFSICNKRFNNIENFNGFPYMPPTDSERNPVGKGVYWLDSLVVERDSDGFVGNIEL